MAARIGDNPAALAAREEQDKIWPKLTDEYKQIAKELQKMAVDHPTDTMRDVGPIYMRQALRMQESNLTLAARRFN